MDTLIQKLQLVKIGTSGAFEFVGTPEWRTEEDIKKAQWIIRQMAPVTDNLVLLLLLEK